MTVRTCAKCGRVGWCDEDVCHMCAHACSRCGWVSAATVDGLCVECRLADLATLLQAPEIQACTLCGRDHVEGGEFCPRCRELVAVELERMRS